MLLEATATVGTTLSIVIVGISVEGVVVAAAIILFMLLLEVSICEVKLSIVVNKLELMLELSTVTYELSELGLVLELSVATLEVDSDVAAVDVNLVDVVRVEKSVLVEEITVLWKALVDFIATEARLFVVATGVTVIVDTTVVLLGSVLVILICSEELCSVVASELL